MDPIKTQVVVLGAGPGGYAAAFYAADKGKKVILVEKDARLGGVCLNRGCIPSKALLHASYLVEQTKESSRRGIHFAPPSIDMDELRQWKESILDKLGQGIRTLADKRGVQVLQGRGHFEDSQTLRVETSSGQQFIQYEQAIIAVGSRSTLPKAFDLGNPRIMTSRHALELQDVPKDLLVIGGGYIGMELSTVYATLGSRIVMVEALDTVLRGADPDLARPVVRYAEKTLKEIRVNTKVLKMATAGKQIRVEFQIDGKNVTELYDRVLVSVGRTPNCEDLGLENTKVACDEKGFIKVNNRQQTNDPAIYAIGDVTGGLMLAHKAAKEARIAVEVLAGESSLFEQIIIPSVIFTHPEIAWCGLTETEAKMKGLAVEIARFPWAASGRALTMETTDGLTKLIIDRETERVLGVGIVGMGAGELIGEGVVAIEMGATARDLAECVHPHPTLSETLMECAEAFFGHATHTLARKKTAH